MLLLIAVWLLVFGYVLVFHGVNGGKISFKQALLGG